MTDDTTTFEDIDNEYRDIIEREIDNDIRDFRWAHGINDLGVSREDMET
jgi:hypothetical protein